MNYDSEYDVQRQILNEIGGDGSQTFDSAYSIQLAILEEVQGGGGGGIPDAPRDGKLYGRKDGDWSEVAGGDLSNYYTKDETDGLLEDKADKDSTYTKTQIDASITNLTGMIAAKQDMLEAGNGIDITDNVISTDIDSTTLTVAFYSNGEEKETGSIEVLSTSDNISDKHLVTQDYVDNEIHLGIADLTGTVTGDSTNDLVSVSVSEDSGILSEVSIDDTNLKSALDAKLTDAPSDNKLYGRQNGAWEEVVVGEVAKIYVLDGATYVESLKEEIDAILDLSDDPEVLVKEFTNRVILMANDTYFTVTAYNDGKLYGEGRVNDELHYYYFDTATALDATIDLHEVQVVEDAPYDGKQYARQNGAWSEVSGGDEEHEEVVAEAIYNIPVIEETDNTMKITNGKLESTLFESTDYSHENNFGAAFLRGANVGGSGAAYCSIIAGSYNNFDAGLSRSFIAGESNRMDSETKNCFIGGEHLAVNQNHLVIGEYNQSKLLYPFVIGNGTGDDSRSNAYEIDNSGNSVQSGSAKASEFVNSSNQKAVIADSANTQLKIWTGTQDDYDAIVTKDLLTIYIITE